MRQTTIIIWPKNRNNIEKSCHHILSLFCVLTIVCSARVCVRVLCRRRHSSTCTTIPIKCLRVKTNHHPIATGTSVWKRQGVCVCVHVCVNSGAKICTTKWMVMLHLGRGKLPKNRFSSFIIFIVPVLCVSKCQHNLQNKLYILLLLVLLCRPSTGELNLYLACNSIKSETNRKNKRRNAAFTYKTKQKCHYFVFPSSVCTLFLSYKAVFNSRLILQR